MAKPPDHPTKEAPLQFSAPPQLSEPTEGEEKMAMRSTENQEGPKKAPKKCDDDDDVAAFYALFQCPTTQFLKARDFCFESLGEKTTPEVEEFEGMKSKTE